MYCVEQWTCRKMQRIHNEIQQIDWLIDEIPTNARIVAAIRRKVVDIEEYAVNGCNVGEWDDEHERELKKTILEMFDKVAPKLFDCILKMGEMGITELYASHHKLERLREVIRYSMDLFDDVDDNPNGGGYSDVVDIPAPEFNRLIPKTIEIPPEIIQSSINQQQTSETPQNTLITAQIASTASETRSESIKEYKLPQIVTKIEPRRSSRVRKTTKFFDS